MKKNIVKDEFKGEINTNFKCFRLNMLMTSEHQSAVFSQGKDIYLIFENIIHNFYSLCKYIIF